jgi:Cof subfamily protein (haloacid dehalogenase superfamily)
VQAFACDLDRTLIGEDAVLSPRAVNAIASAHTAGIRVIIATGRMFRGVKPYLDQAGIADPVICYQGAAVVDPSTGTFLLHEPIPLELALEAIALLNGAGFPPNCYVADELVVAKRTPYSDAYSSFQDIPVTEVGDLTAWLAKPPTKLVAVGDPHELDLLRARLAPHFGARLHVTTSLPWLLELGHPLVSKGTGLLFVAQQLGFAPEQTVAFGDGENDVELLAQAGYGVAVERSHERLLAVADWTCPGPDDDGVPRVIEAFLDSRA